MKQTLTLFLALLMCLTLVACNIPKVTEAVLALDEEIISIGEVSLKSEELILSLEEKYANLSEQEQAALTNYALLTQAREKLDQCKADVQTFAEKLSLCFAKLLSPSSVDNLKIQKCWYYYNSEINQYYFTYYTSTMAGDGFDYTYWGTPEYVWNYEHDYRGIRNLSDETLQNAIDTCGSHWSSTDYDAIQEDDKYALREGGIELDAEAIQNYYMRYSEK